MIHTSFPTGALRPAIPVGRAGSRDNVYYLDGFNITGMAGGTAAFTLHNSVISELEVITSGVPAEYGGGAGYVANLATKDGGPTLTGAAELYLRRSGMYESFETDDPRLQAVREDKYDAGVTLGGLLVRERLWFFAAGQLRSNTSDVELSPSASPRRITIPSSRRSVRTGCSSSHAGTRSES